jgi:hypothetical protein
MMLIVCVVPASATLNALLEELETPGCGVEVISMLGDAVKAVETNIYSHSACRH